MRRKYFRGILIQEANFPGEIFWGTILHVQIFYGATFWSRLLQPSLPIAKNQIKLLKLSYIIKARSDVFYYVNPLMSDGNKKVTHTYTNLQLNTERSAAGLFKYVWPFSYHQALKG